MSDFYETLMASLARPRAVQPDQPPAAPSPPPEPSSRQPRYKTILQTVAAQHGVSVVDLRGPSRVKKIAVARFEAAYRLRVDLALSFPKIGQILGGRHHTTIMHAVEQHAARLEATGGPS